MKRKISTFLGILIVAAAPAFALAQITSSTTIIIPNGTGDEIFQIVSNLFALNSLGALVILIVGVLLAFTAIELLIQAIKK